MKRKIIKIVVGVFVIAFIVSMIEEIEYRMLLAKADKESVQKCRDIYNGYKKCFTRSWEIYRELEKRMSVKGATALTCRLLQNEIDTKWFNNRLDLLDTHDVCLTACEEGVVKGNLLSVGETPFMIECIKNKRLLLRQGL
ncbi:hypothetical protein [Hydrogenobacter thermophilus]|jgi:hypothetical protein|uniref:hypothetical protein n=1 Tax=Hydrogenobacter thermophilus TaxID=940 RepID=UPI0030F90FF9